MDDSISVERLVKIAEELAEQGHFRAAVMEAMTALEERANEVVFQSLEMSKGLPANLVKWLKDKTKYSFDEKYTINALSYSHYVVAISAVAAVSFFLLRGIVTSNTLAP